MLEHQDAIAPDHNDPLHELLEDLGEAPSVEALIGIASYKIMNIMMMHFIHMWRRAARQTRRRVLPYAVLGNFNNSNVWVAHRI